MATYPKLTEDQRELLEGLAEELDVPPTKYEDAKTHYDAVGAWLGSKDSPLAIFEPAIYPQGSFVLGTAVRPVGDEDEYDVDLVCVLNTTPQANPHRRVKGLVGSRLNSSGVYSKLLLPEKRRCWTLKYADGSRFHLDVLPAIPRPANDPPPSGVPPAWDANAIWITDSTLPPAAPIWPRSNPRAYAEWFKRRMYEVFITRKRLIAAERKSTIDAVPGYEVRTPLQRVVQVLKRHRDIRMAGDDHRPISVIVTTLAAMAYGGEASVAECLANGVPRFVSFFEQRGDCLWLPNPVEPRENLADRCRDIEQRRGLERWLDMLNRDVAALIAQADVRGQERVLSESFGRNAAVGAVDRLRKKRGGTTSYPRGSSMGQAVLRATAGVERALAYATEIDVSHREAPAWQPDLRYAAEIRGSAHRAGFRTIALEGRGVSLPPDWVLDFEVATNAPSPYTVYWQIVNTGPVAARIPGGLRGSILLDGGAGTRRETTLYTGRHWIEAFIVQGDRCVARSREFFVNVT